MTRKLYPAIGAYRRGRLRVSSLHELYYEACVRRAPHTTTSAECFRRFEESIYFGYSGSGGVSLPDDVRKNLAELRDLSAPET